MAHLAPPNSIPQPLERCGGQAPARHKTALAEALFAGAAKIRPDLTEADVSALFAPRDRRQSRAGGMT